MISFSHRFRAALRSCLLGALAASGSSASADVIELSNGDLLTGTISALDKHSATIRSSVSTAPLEVRAAAVKRMTFSGAEKKARDHSERVTLVNGDVLPCQVISMDRAALRISTWYAGDFTIPRKDIRSLRFGLSPERTIYTGDDAPSAWDTKQGNWVYSKGTYTSKSTGVLARKVAMPENVRIRFNFAWQDTPNFVFRFCAESDTATTKQDCYELTYNSAGMQISRYQGRSQHAPIANIGLKPHEVEDKKINIDIRVNRRLGTLTLYLDGKKIDTWPDTFDTAGGNFLVFNNRARNDNACIISGLTVGDWSAGSAERHRAKVAQSKMDVLIDSEGENISGSIGGISPGKADKRVIRFDVKHSDKPLLVPDRRVSILYFGHSSAPEDHDKPVFTAHLRGHGALQLDQPQLKDGKIITRHPILGPCTLDPSVVANIAQTAETAP